MKIYVDSYGQAGLKVADKMATWLPFVIQGVTPWDKNKIQIGAQTLPSLTEILKEARVGIFCITKENYTSPPMLFAAGAIWNKLNNESLICLYLIDISEKELETPYNWFNPVSADKPGTKKLISTIYDNLPPGKVDKNVVDKAFEDNWEELEKVLCEARTIIVGQPSSEKIAPVKIPTNQQLLGITGKEEDIKIIETRNLSLLQAIFNNGLPSDYLVEYSVILKYMMSTHWTVDAIKLGLSRLERQGYIKDAELGGVRAYIIKADGLQWLFDNEWRLKLRVSTE